MRIDLKKRSWQWGMLIFLAFIWGTSFILMKKGLESFTNFQVGGMRIFFSFIFFLPLIYRNYHKINKNNIVSLLIVGFIGNAIPAFLFATTQTQLNSSVTGILNSMTPLFTLMIGVILYRNRVRLVSVAGLIIGILGAIGLITGVNSLEIGDVNSWYGIFAIIGTICYGININEIKFKLKELDGVAIASLGFLFTGPITGVMLLLSDYSIAAESSSLQTSLLSVIALAFFSSFMAITFMNILIKFTTTLFAASVTYIIPVFAVFWGIIDGEPFYFMQIMWALLILFGVYIVNSSEKIDLIVKRFFKWRRSF